MNNIVRHSMDELRKINVSEDLRRVAEMPDDEINTTDVPERHFNVARAMQRREHASQPVAPTRRKAS